MMVESMKVILEKTKFLGGLAILENANEETAELRVVDRDELLEVEPALLAKVPRIDGQDSHSTSWTCSSSARSARTIPGAGIDPNVVGRLLIEAAPEMETNKPKITRICCLDLSPESHGNGTGVGIADLTTDRLLAVDRPDPVPHEQPHGPLPLAVEAAIRIPDRSRSASSSRSKRAGSRFRRSCGWR